MTNKMEPYAMIVSKIVRHATTIVGAAMFGLAALSASASAQSWDWGGGTAVDGAGRETVNFSTAFKPGQLVVSFGDRRLYHVTAVGKADSYPIAIPREQSRWQGVMSITQKKINPSWTPTPTMRAENPRLPMWVPGGHPMNPLGVRGLYLGSSTYRIHGTDAPWTIGQPVSKGCIRMYNQDVIALYDRVPVGTKVTVTWQRFGGGAPLAASETEPPKPASASRRTASQSRPYYRTTRPIVTSAE